jgi:hypothetical protein
MDPRDPLNEHLERLLDEALEQTFPASDPIAVSPAYSGVTYAAVIPPSTKNSVPVM